MSNTTSNFSINLENTQEILPHTDESSENEIRKRTKPDDVLRDISLGIKSFVHSKHQPQTSDRTTHSLAYLGAELVSLPANEADCIMDIITSNLLDLTKEIRDHKSE
ncbi:hypothetical protein ABEB36_009291 [Hypothenemus hampei]|uniref:Uncharacterized protein n=1 Tax=Hypothenemus hampei TaxID=57062 RepID=A0ABD1EFX2_HYPHA